ncbi:MAG TPA: SURF1 family protein [Actinomycetota bacterium]
MARPVLRRAVLVGIGIVVAAVCVRLGVWQLDRLEQRRASNDAVRTGLAAEPTTLAAAMQADDPAYRRVVVTGVFDATHEVILYGRTQEGRPGDHVLTPLVVSDGEAVLVDRGWIPFEPDRSVPVEGPAAAVEGDVTVEGFLVRSEDTGEDTGPTIDTIQRIDLERLGSQMPYRLAPFALQLERQSPAVDAPVPAPRPDLPEGPHLSYAIQWFAFAVIALGGSILIARRDRADNHRASAEGR